MSANDQAAWEAYRDQVLEKIKPILTTLGFSLDERQVHTGGERYLTNTARDVGGGGLKLVLTGRRISDGTRVIIKASNNPQGIKEIERERECREVLHRIKFAVRAFRTPEELLHTRHGEFVFSITSYIEQERAFIEHTLDEQFFLALRAFETQEGVHATTNEHAQIIKKTFGMETAEDYLRAFDTYQEKVFTHLPERPEFKDLFKKARDFLHANKTTIARYCGFLTHADFVPNNLRVANRDIFLLDYASIHFGNKYEGWARFLNFMIHHNAALERTLAEYVRTNRGEEEYLVLRLMRIYKIGFLLAFYAQALSKTSGNLRTLTEERLILWREAMNAVLQDMPVPESVVSAYVTKIDMLRTEDEKARQQEILGRQ